MSVPRYESYRDNSAEGLGMMPAHWNLAPAKYALTARSGGASIKGECADAPEDGLFQGFSASGPNVWLPEYEHDGPGLVLSAVGARCGRVFKADGKWGVVANTHCLLPRLGMDRDFLWYLTNDENWWEKGGTAQPFVKVPDSLARKIGLPPLAEQTAIAAFLDRETGKIDALVEAQRRLIELLKEKRQAVISHTITKGLDRAAPMKDSGVEWLGEVPAHWDIVPLKRNLVFLTSGSRGWAEYYADDGALFLRIGNLTRDRVDLDLADIQRVAVPPGSEGERTRVQSGDVLFSITAFLGSVGVVPPELETAFVSQHVALARLADGRLLPKWVAYVTLSRVGKTQLEMGGYGGTKIQLSLGDVGDLLMTVPPTSEQVTILNWLDAKLQEFSALESEAEKAIFLLQERRAALISAAVTGKIDVRGLAPEQAEAA